LRGGKSAGKTSLRRHRSFQSAISTGSAGQAGAKTSLKLTFCMDHSAVANHQCIRGCLRSAEGCEGLTAFLEKRSAKRVFQ
jgi:hypothetical protein